MKIHLKQIFLAASVWSSLIFNAHAVDTGAVNLVKPVVAPLAVEAIIDAKGRLVCEVGLVLMKNGSCCPEGTTNDNKWPLVCTLPGTIEDQIFNFNKITHYCPSSDMYIVSDKNRKWFSCADSNSSAMYAVAKKSEGSEFCMKHGYGYLIKIKPSGTVGCVKVDDSQGDGCIEAGTCSFGKGR